MIYSVDCFECFSNDSISADDQLLSFSGNGFR